MRVEVTMRRTAYLPLLWLTACGAQVTLESADANSSVLVPQQANAAANGVDTVPLLIRLAKKDGTPLAGVNALISASHCIVVQPTSVTDAQGVARGKIRCNAPVRETVHVALVFNNASTQLAPLAEVNFYPSDSSGGVTAGTELLAQAAVYDANGVVDLEYRGTVQFQSSDPLATLPGPYTLSASDLGYKNLGKSLVLRSVGRQTVTCSDSQTGRALSVQTYTVVPLAVTSLQLTVDNTAPHAAELVSVTVHALDGFGNINSAYREVMTFASSDPLATLPAAYTFTAADAGVKTFPSALALRTSGAQLVFVNGGGLSGLQKFTVSGGATAGLRLTTDANATAGAPVPVQVAAVDAFGNVSPTYTGTVHFTASAVTAQLPLDLVFDEADAGVKTTSLVLTQAGVTAVAVADLDDATLAVDSSNLLVAAASPAALVLNTPANAVAGQSLNLVVAAVDAYGNTSPGYTGTVALQSSDAQGTVPSNYVFTATDRGAHSFVQGLRVIIAGSTTVRAHDLSGAVQDGNRITTVVPAPVAAVRVSTPSASITAGGSIDLNVAAVDTYGNLVPSYTGTVQLTNPDPNGTVVPSVTIMSTDAGQVAVPAGASFTTSGMWPITGSDLSNPQLTSIPANLTVNAGPLVSISFTGIPSSASVAQLLTATVSAQDVYQNPVTSYRGTVHFSSTDGNAVLPADHTFTAQDGGSVTWTAGVSLFTVSSASRVSVQDSVFGAPVNSPDVNVQHRCGYLDGLGGLPGFGGFVRSTDAAFDSHGRPYLVGIVELGAARFQNWQLYAQQFLGAGWSQTVENPPRPATSAIDLVTYTDYAASPSVALDANDDPTVAYYGSGTASGVYVMQRHGTSWNQLGTSGQTPIGPNGSNPVIKLDSHGRPWVLWLDNAAQLHLQGWNGTQWVGPGGNELVPTALVQPDSGTNRNYDLAVDGHDNVYVAWALNADQPSVRLLTWSGTAWAALAGSNSVGGISQSSGQALEPYVAIVAGNLPAVSWTDNASGHAEVYLRQYNGSAWVQLAGSATGGGVSQEAGIALNVGLSVDRHGRLLALWVPTLWGYCSSGNVPAHFVRWSGSAWAGVNSSATYTGCDYVDELDSNGNGASPKLGTDLNDVPVLLWRAFGYASACAFN